MPWALTEIEPPTREDVGRLHRLDREARMDRVLDVVPGRARRRPSPCAAPASSRIAFMPRMSSMSPPARNACPPMLNASRRRPRRSARARAHRRAPPRPPPRCAAATTPATGVRLRQLASLTVPPRCAQCGSGTAADRQAAARSTARQDARRNPSARRARPSAARHRAPAPAATRAMHRDGDQQLLALHLASLRSRASSAARKPASSSICGIWPTPGKRAKLRARISPRDVSPCAIGVTVSASPQIRCDRHRDPPKVGAAPAERCRRRRRTGCGSQAA